MMIYAMSIYWIGITASLALLLAMKEARIEEEGGMIGCIAPFVKIFLIFEIIVFLFSMLL